MFMIMCMYMHVFMRMSLDTRAQEEGFLVAENEPGMMHNELQQHRAKAVGSEKLIERARQMCRSS